MTEDPRETLLRHVRAEFDDCVQTKKHVARIYLMPDEIVLHYSFMGQDLRAKVSNLAWAWPGLIADSAQAIADEFVGVEVWRLSGIDKILVGDPPMVPEGRYAETAFNMERVLPSEQQPEAPATLPAEEAAPEYIGPPPVNLDAGTSILPSIMAHILGDGMRYEDALASIERPPAYVRRIIEAGRAASVIVAQLVEAQIADGNFNSVPEDIRGWYAGYLVATLEESEYLGATAKHCGKIAERLGTVLSHLQRRNCTANEQNAAIVIKRMLGMREACLGVEDRTYGGVIPDEVPEVHAENGIEEFENKQFDILRGDTAGA